MMRASSSSRSFRVLTIEGSLESLEIATAFLEDYDCLGSEQMEPSLSPESEASKVPAGILRAYFEDETEIEPIASALARRWPALTCRVDPPVPDRDWLLEWKRRLKGFPVGSRYFVLPTWCEPVLTERTVLRIDPERAFGTGTHETTALGVELIEAYVGAGADVIDVGTGTGILAMVAALEGASRVRALEPDPDAYECAVRNIARNGLRDIVEADQRGWEDLPSMSADVVVANINAVVLRPAVERMYGTLLLTGILASEMEAFIRDLPATARLEGTRQSGEWAALVVTRARDERRA